MKKQIVKKYSDSMEAMFFFPRRKEVAMQILSVLKNSLRSKNMKEVVCLEIGTSAGTIANVLSEHFKKIVGIDVDTKAAIYWKKQKKKNIEFKLMDAMNLTFKDKTFDVVITNQDYEFIFDEQKLMDEIYRVLKPGGICFFGARNKLAIMEGQYNIPFLAWLPKNLAKKYIEATGRKKYILAKYMTMWELQSICKKFIIKDYTIKILQNPEKFNYNKIKKYKPIINLFPSSILSFFKFLVPNFIWVLQKPRG